MGKSSTFRLAEFPACVDDLLTYYGLALSNVTPR
jgi:hypothetical protein